VNKNAYKTLIAAEYVGVKIETTPDFDWATIKSPEFIKMNPMGKVSFCFLVIVLSLCRILFWCF
jgi:hypothetical protein